jgi:hypothetical protein
MEGEVAGSVSPSYHRRQLAKPNTETIEEISL